MIRAGRATAGPQGGFCDLHFAYVTSHTGFRTPFVRAHHIDEVLTHREKHLQVAFRARDVGILTIKKREVEIDSAALHRRLAMSGTSEATLVLTRRSGAGVALRARHS